MNVMLMSRVTPEMQAIVLVAGIVLAALIILYHIAFWCLLQKMGRHDFAALIPVYGAWEYARGAGFGAGLATIMAFVNLLALLSAQLFVYTFGYDGFWEDFSYAFLLAGDNGAGAMKFAIELFIKQFFQFNPLLMCALISSVAYLVLHLVASFGVSRSFGHGFFVAIGLVVLPIIYVSWLGGSRGQYYDGPYFGHTQRFGEAEDWTGAVDARLDAFGSNAPLALAILGMMMGASFLSIPGIVLCLLALVRNSREKAKPLSGSKHAAAKLIAIIGLALNIAGLAIVLTFGDITKFVQVVL